MRTKTVYIFRLLIRFSSFFRRLLLLFLILFSSLFLFFNLQFRLDRSKRLIFDKRFLRFSIYSFHCYSDQWRLSAFFGKTVTKSAFNFSNLYCFAVILCPFERMVVLLLLLSWWLLCL